MRRLALLAAVVAVAGCGGGGSKPAKNSPAKTQAEVTENSSSGETRFDAQAIYASESPGVVTIVSLFGGGDGGEGSGFVLNAQGEIATNAHVVTSGTGRAIKRASEVYVEFSDGNRVAARILGEDPNADVALLKVDTAGLKLKPLPLGDITKVKVGAPVAAIGSPFGREQSLSVGVVSAVDRSVASLTDFQISGAIQTDAAINPGNSGGPLVAADGTVIGINQQIETKSGGGEGVGFAVPVDVVKHSLDLLRETGAAHYAYIGVISVGLYPQLVAHFKLDVQKGVWVQAVNQGSPAQQGGVQGGSGDTVFQGAEFRQGGDVITKVGDTAVEDTDDLSAAVAMHKPGETVKVEVHRGGATKLLDVKLQERPLGDPSRTVG